MIQMTMAILSYLAAGLLMLVFLTSIDNVIRTHGKLTAGLLFLATGGPAILLFLWPLVAR